MAPSNAIPDFLFDTHARYKFDTNVFISWLSETARRCGYFVNTSRSANKSKPKAKKGGKKAVKPQPNEVIPLNELPTLANTIAEADCEVPLNILLVLKHIIRARGECADWYSRLDGDEEYQESNEGHQHVVRVFKEILEILHPQAPSGVADGKRRLKVVDNSGKPIGPKLTNSFDGLEVENPSSDLEEYIVQTPMAKKKSKAPEKTYVMEEPYSDYMMEVIFFFQDLRKLREHLRQLWQDYQDGKVDLTSASVATDLAIEMVQRNEREFMQSRSCVQSSATGSNYLETGGDLFLTLCDIHGVRADNAFTGKSNEIAESLCFYTYLHLQDYLSMLQPGQMTILRNKNAKDIDPKRDRDTLSLKERSNEDRDILWALLPDIQPLSTAAFADAVSLGQPGADLPPLDFEIVPIGLAISAKDKISQGILKAQSSENIPIWLVFAVQELLDIFHITRKESGKALVELRLTATKIDNSLQEYYAFSRIQFSKSWNPSKEALFHRLSDFIDQWVNHDKIGELRGKFSPDIGKRHPFWLLKYHPMLCGHFIFYMNLAMQNVGRILAASWGCTVAAIHLYNASRKSKFNKHSWPDLDLLLTVHDEDWLFYGGAPKRPIDFYKKFYFSMGNSPQNIAPNRRDNQPHVNAVQRKLTLVDSVSKMLTYRFSDVDVREKGDACQKFTLERVEMVLNTAAARKRVPEHQALSEELVYHGRLKKSRRQTEPSRLTPIQFLDALCVSLNSESTILNFDYPALHMRCLKMLREIHTETAPILRQMYAKGDLMEILPANFDTDDALGELPFWVFRSHYEVATQAEHMKIRDSRGQMASICFVAACKIVERIATEEGSAELDKVHQLRGKCEVLRQEMGKERDAGANSVEAAKDEENDISWGLQKLSLGQMDSKARQATIEDAIDDEEVSEPS